MDVLLFFSYIPVLIFLNLGTIASAALSRNAACYYPDGHQATGDFACFLDQDQSPCCGSGSICEESGLCKVAGSIGVSNLIRGTCTDHTWGSSACSIFCKEPASIGPNLISCQNATGSDLDFCCDHTSECCDSGIGRFQVQGNTDVLTLGDSGATISTFTTASSSISSSSSAAPTLSPSSATTTTSSSSVKATSPASATSAATTATITIVSNAASSGLSTGVKAGIGVACGLVGAIIVGAVLYFVLKHRRSNRVLFGSAGSTTLDDSTKGYQAPPPLASEMHAETWRAEIMTYGGHQDRAELPND